MRPEDRAAHDWYRFVLSFPPHLVRTYLERFDVRPGQTVLDPFCGTGTTLVECKKRGIAGVGVERNPMAHFASCTKLDWSIDPDGLLAHARLVAEDARALLQAQGDLAEASQGGKLWRLSDDVGRILLKGSISPIPLHKVLVLLEVLQQRRDLKFDAHERLALARTIVFEASNLSFGPEVGIGRPRFDAAVNTAWLREIDSICTDLRQLSHLREAHSTVYLNDARRLSEVIAADSVDVVITSPPYPNEKDYTRTTRLELAILGFVSNKADLQALKRELVRSNTRGVYRNDDDDALVAEHPEVQRIAEAIEERRLALGKTSGFERMYPRVTRLYFGGMMRHLTNLRAVLKPGARLAYVVGDQASYLRVMIRTGAILADLAERLGYQVEALDLFRTRLATATGEMLREEVVVLSWPGWQQQGTSTRDAASPL